MAKLDYIAELGVNTIWLLPFYPSPRRDDGYDISRYRAVHPDYGTMATSSASSRRRMRAASASSPSSSSTTPPTSIPGSSARGAPSRARRRATSTSGPTPTRNTPARASSSSTPSSRTGPGTRSPSAYFWHRFYSHQPDLNFDNPKVHRGRARRDALLARPRRRRAAARRHAVPDRARRHEQREPSGDARGPQEHPRRRSTRPIRTACCSPRPTSGRRTPQDYFGDGDECHMAFHFPLMPRMYMALAQEDRSRSPTSCARRRRSRTTANGRSSCATTTS